MATSTNGGWWASPLRAKQPLATAACTEDARLAKPLRYPLSVLGKHPSQAPIVLRGATNPTGTRLSGIRGPNHMSCMDAGEVINPCVVLRVCRPVPRPV